MRELVTRESLHALMRELARAAPRGVAGRVFFVGGGTSVWSGWRMSTIDVDPQRLRELVRAVPAGAYARYPALTRGAVHEAIDAWVEAMAGP